MCHSWPGGSPGKTLELPKRQETIVSGCARREDSFPVCPQKVEHRLNEFHRQARAAASSADPGDGHATLMLLLQPPRILCASTGHYLPPNHNPRACAARHCQGPVIQGQLPQENTRSASGCFNIMPASAATG